jgi:hypothetical protein
VREDLTREEVHAAADAVIAELLERAGVAEPPVDAVVLAQGTLGLRVCLERRPQRGRPKRGDGPPLIYLDPDEGEDRHQWIVAQEIGKILQTGLLRRLGIDPAEKRGLGGESLPNLLAQRLLVPTHFLAAEAPRLDYDVEKLHERFRTAGHEAVALRLLDLPEPCVIAIVDNGHVHRRRSNALRVNKELSPAEKECQKYVNHYSRPKVVRAGGWTVHGWPVHRPDWKREILRSVVDGDS